MRDLVGQLKNNPVLIGIVGAMLTGSLLYLARMIPKRLFDLFVHYVTVTLIVSSDEPAFDWINEWLAKHPYSQKARVLALSTMCSDREQWAISPGAGYHLLWDNGPILLHREIGESKSGLSRKVETFKIRTFARSQARVRRIVENARLVRDASDHLQVQMWQGYWATLQRKTKRPVSSIVLPPGMVEEIIEDARWFFSSADWFTRNGRRHRHGWKFQGVGGSGKTTIAEIVASYFSKPLCYIALSTVNDDNELVRAFAQADRNAIILLEDIDTVRAAHKREPGSPAPDPVSQPPTPDGKKDDATPRGVTLSGLFNAIDGVVASDGRLLIMTTNFPEKLDPVLVRSGRIDRTWTFGNMEIPQAEEMARRFFPGDDRVLELVRQPRTPMSASDWQVLFMSYERDPDRALSESRAQLRERGAA